MFSHNKDPLTSIIKQEMFSDVSVRPRHKGSSDVSSYTFPSDVSKLFTRSCQNKEQKSSSQKWDPQYDVNHFRPSLKSPTYPLRVVGNTVIKGDNGNLQKSQSSSFVSETVLRRKTHSTSQTMQHVADFESKTEKLKATPYTGVMTAPHMATSAILQTELQSVNVEAKTEKVAASLYTGVTDEENK
ncbi:uncharacterized protein LOC143815154 [Ranitomeya variabilis]|uniref:uncharacterized protein LOC143815154 n=1 Tax=Ranitomeya variabilis TaxID=490064 RepID=UPI004056BF46